MAQVQYDHIEAPGEVRIGGTLAYVKGDPVPVDVAARYGIEGDVIEGVAAPEAGALFRDVAIVIAPAEADEAKADEAEADNKADDKANPPPTKATRPRVTPPTTQEA